MKHSVLILCFLIPTLGLFSQLSVTDSISSDVLIEWLEGENLTIENLTVNCVEGAIGTFSYAGTDLSMNEGVIMASGFVEEAIGPNETGSRSGQMSSPYSDSDMDALTSGMSFDVCAIEFDCVPDFSFLLFNYIFGSEEYPEFVNSFNDGFGFFVSGPGITGSYSSPAGFPDGSENYCQVPNTGLPVTINNVNNGNQDCTSGGPDGPCMNCEYYVDNCGGMDIEYDGLTTNLPGVVQVTPGSTYHVKIGIADAFDMIYDSGVFIEKQSFRSANVVSLLDEKPLIDVKLFPNPSKDEISLDGLEEDMYVFQVLNLNGQMVKQASKRVSGKVDLDIKSLAEGHYLLRIHGSAGASFIIEFQKD